MDWVPIYTVPYGEHSSFVVGRCSECSFSHQRLQSPQLRHKWPAHVCKTWVPHASKVNAMTNLFSDSSDSSFFCSRKFSVVHCRTLHTQHTESTLISPYWVKKNKKLCIVIYFGSTPVKRILAITLFTRTVIFNNLTDDTQNTTTHYTNLSSSAYTYSFFFFRLSCAATYVVRGTLLVQAPDQLIILIRTTTS